MKTCMLPLLLFVGVSCIATASASADLLPAESYFQEVGGVVVGEAENFHNRTSNTTDPNATEWLVVPTESSPAGTFLNARGEEFIQSLADDSKGIVQISIENPNPTPTIEYRMNIQTTGVYQLFLRWDCNATTDATAGGSDSIFADIVEIKDGELGAADWHELDKNDDGDFATTPWDGRGGAEINAAGTANNPVTWTISNPGIYTLRLSVREDGSAVDAWAFQLDSLDDPTGDGPAESTVVPEPSTLAMLLGFGGLLALIAHFRRRR